MEIRNSQKILMGELAPFLQKPGKKRKGQLLLGEWCDIL